MPRRGRCPNPPLAPNAAPVEGVKVPGLYARDVLGPDAFDVALDGQDAHPGARVLGAGWVVLGRARLGMVSSRDRALTGSATLWTYRGRVPERLHRMELSAAGVQSTRHGRGAVALEPALDGIELICRRAAGQVVSDAHEERVDRIGQGWLSAAASEPNACHRGAISLERQQATHCPNTGLPAHPAGCE